MAYPIRGLWPQRPLGGEVKKFKNFQRRNNEVRKMSFIITLWTQDGLVMASDSRLTLTVPSQQNNQQIPISFTQSDANNKTFLAAGNIGISTFGAADIQGVPISGFVESFIHEKIEGREIDLTTVPRQLLEYFRSLPVIPDTGFVVAGYIEENGKQIPHIWRIIVKLDQITDVIKPGQQGGAAWNGEIEVMTRLISPVSIAQPDGSSVSLPEAPIPWIFFTLQDAIDFAIYAVKVTRDTMRFLAKIKTVGGPVDVLIIRPGQGPDRAKWIQRKELGGDGRYLLS
jgi:hypothetical protein